MKLLEKTLLYPVGGGPTPSCHASSVCVLPGGKSGPNLMTAWFGGHHESADDVEIWSSVREEGCWSAPRQMSLSSDEACWNPVLFARDNLVTLFFKRGRKITSWKTFVRRSEDGGKTFGPEEELVPGDESGGRGPVKDKPLLLKSGILAAGASHESPDGKIWRAFIDRSPDCGITWERTPYLIPDPPARLIQPTLWEDADGVHALLRSDAGRIYRADSADGLNWSAARPIGLPNNNSGIDCAGVPDGRLLLVCNPVGRDRGGRTPLSLLVSRDGGRTWKRELDLARGEGEYSYPAIVTSDGLAHITFTWNRKSIAYACVDIG